MAQKISRVLSIAFYAEMATALGVVLYVLLSPSPLPGAVSLSPATAMGSMMGFSLLFFVAMVFILLAIFAKGEGVIYNRSLFLNLASFILLSAVWLLTESQIPYLLPIDQRVVPLCAYFSFHLLPVPFLFFVSGLCVHGEKSFNFWRHSFWAAVG